MDFRGNDYKIYDLMYLGEWGRWRSFCTYFSLEEALEYNKDIRIEDVSGE